MRRVNETCWTTEPAVPPRSNCMSVSCLKIVRVDRFASAPEDNADLANGDTLPPAKEEGYFCYTNGDEGRGLLCTAQL